MKRTYGWTPDIPDFRDVMYGVSKPVTMPLIVDLRPLCSPVEDQGDLGSCTANALVGNLEFLMNKDKKQFHDMSRLFLYYNERVIEGTVRSDSGAMIRDGIKTMRKQGVCLETSWPYNVNLFAAKPPASCYTEALEYQILSYQRLNTIDQMRQCLAKGFPFVFGFAVYESFESQAVANTGMVPYPRRTEKFLGGHAVMAVGYDDKVRKFIVRNSWGTNWGMEGYFMIDYAYLDNRNLSDDFWTIKSAENM